MAEEKDIQPQEHAKITIDADNIKKDIGWVITNRDKIWAVIVSVALIFGWNLPPLKDIVPGFNFATTDQVQTINDTLTKLDQRLVSVEARLTQNETTTGQMVDQVKQNLDIIQKVLEKK